MRNSVKGALVAMLCMFSACDSPSPTSVLLDLSPVSTKGGPGSSSSTSINFLSPASNAPSLSLAPVSFYAVQGADRRVEIFYNPRPDQSSPSSLLRLRIRQNAQIVLPDGTSLAAGDSVQITINVLDPLKLIVQFQPSGLRFVGPNVAELRMSFLETNRDLNHDGVVDNLDRALERTLSIYRQEGANDPFLRVSSIVSSGSSQVDSFIGGFTNYVIAY